MPDLLVWVLFGILLYTVAAMGLRSLGYLPEYLKVSGPLLTIHTKRGRAFLDRLARHERFWRAWGSFGVGIALVIMVLGGIVVALSAPAIISQPESAAIQNPQNALVIPGVNDFLPLSAAPEIIFGLLVGMVVHEGGHGLLCRVEDIKIDSMGVALFALIPLGAFVEPDEEDQHRANRGAQTRMFAAGITNNLAVCAISMVILVPLVLSISVVPGAPVGDTFPGSGAAESGLERGDTITAINGTTVENASDLDDTVDAVESEHLAVTREDGSTVTVDRRLIITGAVPGQIEDLESNESQPPRVQSVNGTAVSTERELARAVETRPVATIGTDAGNTTIPVGVFVAIVDADGPLGNAGAPTDGTPVVITHIDETRVSNTSALPSVLDRYEPGDEIEVVAYVDGDPETYNVTVGSGADDQPVLGVGTRGGYSGILFDDFGVDPYPAETFLSMLDGSALSPDLSLPATIAGYIGWLLVLPFTTLLPGFNYNFAGFTPDVAGFFVVQGPLAALSGLVFLTVNLLFWTWWINFNLALFNCIPSFPLDGGHILRTSTESIVSRLPIPHRRTVVSVISLSVTAAMIAALLVLLFGPLVLS